MVWAERLCPGCGCQCQMPGFRAGLSSQRLWRTHYQRRSECTVPDNVNTGGGVKKATNRLWGVIHLLLCLSLLERSHSTPPGADSFYLSLKIKTHHLVAPLQHRWPLNLNNAPPSASTPAPALFYLFFYLLHPPPLCTQPCENTNKEKNKQQSW